MRGSGGSAYSGMVEVMRRYIKGIFEGSTTKMNIRMDGYERVRYSHYPLEESKEESKEPRNLLFIKDMSTLGQKM